LAKSAKQGAVELQNSAAQFLESSSKTQKKAMSEKDDVKKLALLMKAQAYAEQATALSRAAANLAHSR
jgi:hypothetical protein